MRRLRPLHVVVPFAVAGACRSAGPASAPVLPDAAPARVAAQQPASRDPLGDTCRVQVPGARLSGWDQIDGPGFTFCVPPGGEIVGSVWRVSGTHLMFGRGSHEPAWDPAVFVRRTVTWWSPDMLADRSNVQYKETVDGHPAVLWYSREGDNYQASIRWRDVVDGPWVRIETVSPADANVLLPILRSIRFARPVTASDARGGA